MSQSTSNTGQNIIPAGSTVIQPLYLRPSVDLTPPGFDSQVVIYDGNVFYEKSVRTGGALFSCEYIAFGAGDLEFGDVGGEVDANDPGVSQIVLATNATGQIACIIGNGNIVLQIGQHNATFFGGFGFDDTGGSEFFSPNGICIDSSGQFYNGNGGLMINSDAQFFDANNIRILNSQGAAVANATTAVDVITQFNLLLARLRGSTGHGLIAG